MISSVADEEIAAIAICATMTVASAMERGAAGEVALMSRDFQNLSTNHELNAGFCRQAFDDQNPAPVLNLSVHTVKLCNAEDLRGATHGSDLKVVQLAPGSFEGQLTHAQTGTLSISAGDFYPDVRARRDEPGPRHDRYDDRERRRGEAMGL